MDPVLGSSRSGHDLRESASVGVVLGGSWCVWWSDEASSVNLRVCLTVCVSFVWIWVWAVCLLPVGSGMPWMGVAVYVAGWQWAGWRLLVLECWFVCVAIC